MRKLFLALFLALATGGALAQATVTPAGRVGGVGGAGTITASGTPVDDQCAVWTSATVLEGVDCASLTGTPTAGDLSYWTSATAQALLAGTGIVKLNDNAAPDLLTAPAGTVVGTSDAQTLTNKTMAKQINFPGAICQNVTAVTAWSLPAANPAVAACNTRTNVNKGALDFADGANALTAQTWFRLPTGWTGAIDAVITWTSGTTTNNVVWQVAIACASSGDADDPAFTDTVFAADAAAGTANLLNDTATTTITTTGSCAAGDIAHIRLKRDPANAGDTHAATARFMNLQLTYSSTH